MGSAQNFMYYVCVIAFWGCVLCHPGRPDIPDDPIADNIFYVAQTLRNTTVDGYLSVEEMAEIFADFDMNGNLCIDEAEFIARWTEQKLGELDRAITLFHHADTDRDGCIQKNPDYQRMFYYFDRDGVLPIVAGHELLDLLAHQLHYIHLCRVARTTFTPILYQKSSSQIYVYRDV